MNRRLRSKQFSKIEKFQTKLFQLTFKNKRVKEGSCEATCIGPTGGPEKRTKNSLLGSR